MDEERIELSTSPLKGESSTVELFIRVQGDVCVGAFVSRSTWLSYSSISKNWLELNQRPKGYYEVSLYYGTCMDGLKGFEPMISTFVA